MAGGNKMLFLDPATLYMKRSFILLLLICCCQPVLAQEKNKNQKPKDSARVYEKIQEYSKKRKFTKFLHGLIFEPIKTRHETKRANRKKVPKINYSQYEGKIIRKINVVTLDPFGYSEKDASAKPQNYLSKAGNRIHLKSKELTIKNLMLIRRNRPLDSLLVKESERLIRSQRFVRAVVITPVLIPQNPDSVDVYIRELDSWSLIPDFSGSGSRGDFELTERNFLGLGHQFENVYEREFGTGDDAYSMRYTVPNIVNTYIKTSVAYQINLDGDYSKNITVERPFFSPFTRWAAGVFVDQHFHWDTIPDAAHVYARQNFKYNTQDFWAGHAYQLFRENSENERTTNLITSARYLNMNYFEHPRAVYDSVSFYSDERFYMGSIGISSRQFVEDKYVFNYSVIEDIPVGRAFVITAGHQDKNDRSRFYAGARVTLGKYYKWGYLSSNFEYGSFFRNSVSEQSAITAESMYFTNLIECGKWKLRQFAKARLVLGANRVASRGDMLTINETNGIQGFNAPELFGTKKFLLGFQTQGYSPWNFAGFRLNPYLSYTAAFLADAEKGFSKSRLFSQLGVGFIISNDYLVFSSFQFSLAYYPNIPGNGADVFKMNAFSTDDFGFQNFDVGKPRTVDYQ